MPMALRVKDILEI